MLAVKRYLHPQGGAALEGHQVIHGGEVACRLAVAVTAQPLVDRRQVEEHPVPGIRVAAREPQNVPEMRQVGPERRDVVTRHLRCQGVNAEALQQVCAE